MQVIHKKISLWLGIYLCGIQKHEMFFETVKQSTNFHALIYSRS